MLTRDLVKQLKSGEIEKIYLRDGYILKVDPDRKIFISRGGKKRYYLTNSFIDTITCDCNQKDTINNIYFQESIKMLEELLKNNKLGLKTRYSLMNVLILMNSII